jgi:hypothetical protein
MTSEQDRLDAWDQAMKAAGVSSDVALSWLGIGHLLRDGERALGGRSCRYQDPVAEFASTCEELGLPTIESIRWYEAKADPRRLKGYVQRGRSPLDLRRIREALAQAVKAGEIKRSLALREVRAWMLSPLPTAVVLACIHAGIQPSEAKTIAFESVDVLPALATLAALRAQPVSSPRPRTT